MATRTEWAIRRAGQDDRDAVLKLWESAGLSGADELEWQALTNGAAARLLVSHEGEQPIETAVDEYQQRGAADRW